MSIKLKPITKLITIGCFALFVAGCGELASPEPSLKYTVWVGSAVFAVGYQTEEYRQDGDWVLFSSKGGENKRIPVSSIYEISENH